MIAHFVSAELTITIFPDHQITKSIHCSRASGRDKPPHEIACEFFRKNVLFGNHHSEITFGDDEGKSFRVREDNFQQIDVVPSRVFEEAEQRVKAGKDFWVEYKVRIPLYKLFQDIQEYGEPFHFRKDSQHNVMECYFEYDDEFGVQFDGTYRGAIIY